MQHNQTLANGQVLSALAERIRDEHRAVQQAGCNALRHALDAGDTLIEAQTKVSRGWKIWIATHCSINVRTALLYVQLARHRDQIEAEAERFTDLTLRGARRLIAKPGYRRPKQHKAPAPALLTAWNQAGEREKSELFDTINFSEFRKVLSLAFYRKLMDQVRVDKIDADPDATCANLVKKALSLVSIADAPATSKIVAAADIHEAVACLRGLNAKLRAGGRNHHDINVGIVVTNRKVAKRAA